MMITPPLMRSRGWEIKEIGDNGPETPPKNKNRYEVWIHRDDWSTCDQLRKAVFFDRCTGEWSYNGKTITEMNQLP